MQYRRIYFLQPNDQRLPRLPHDKPRTYPVSPSCHHLSSSRWILLSASPAPSVLTQGILFEKATQQNHGWNRWRSVCIPFFCLLFIIRKLELQSSNRVVIMISEICSGFWFFSLLNFIYTSANKYSLDSKHRAVTGLWFLCRTPWDI